MNSTFAGATRSIPVAILCPVAAIAGRAVLVQESPDEARRLRTVTD